MNLIKSGISTSEVWLVIAYGLINYFATVLGIKVPPDVEQWIATTIVAYVLSRTALKYGQLRHITPSATPAPVSKPESSPTGETPATPQA